MDASNEMVDGERVRAGLDCSAPHLYCASSSEPVNLCAARKYCLACRIVFIFASSRFYLLLLFFSPLRSLLFFFSVSLAHSALARASREFNATRRTSGLVV